MLGASRPGSAVRQYRSDRRQSPRLGCFQPGPVMKKAVWRLLVVAIVSWGICYIYPTNTTHFGWIGTLFASTSGLTATISSYQTEEVAHTRGGTIYNAESPIKISADLCFARATTCRFFACLYPRQPGPIWGEVTAKRRRWTGNAESLTICFQSRRS